MKDSPMITNQAFINEDGVHMLRCWNNYNPKGSRMWEIPLDPKHIKIEESLDDMIIRVTREKEPRIDR